MQRALDEMTRRRTIQRAFNLKHNIIPKGISKGISDIMEGAYSAITKEKNKKELMVAEEFAPYFSMSPQKLAKELQKLERKMYQHAEKLEFEEAAQMRDKIEEIKKTVISC